MTQGDHNTIQKAAELLSKSAEPFDQACSMLRHLLATCSPDQDRLIREFFTPDEKKAGQVLSHLLSNPKRAQMVFWRDRGQRDQFREYTVEEVIHMYGPYICSVNTENLDPREVRLLESLLGTWVRMGLIPNETKNSK